MKNNKILVIMILFIAATICVYAIAKNKTNPEKDEPYNPNEVEINDFDLAFLKLETNKENYRPIGNESGWDVARCYENQIERLISFIEKKGLKEEYERSIKS